MTAATATLAIAARLDELRNAAAWLAQAADAGGVPAEAIARLDICLHEALANLIDHAGLPADSEVRLALDVQDASATLTVLDAGKPFDPTEAAAPARPLTLEATVPGGLGLVMIRTNSDALQYSRRDGCNRLSMCVRWTVS